MELSLISLRQRARARDSLRIVRICDIATVGMRLRLSRFSYASCSIARGAGAALVNETISDIRQWTFWNTCQAFAATNDLRRMM